MAETPRRKKVSELARLRAEVEALRSSYLTALVWIAQTAGSPLSSDEVQQLHEMTSPFKREIANG